MNIIIIGEVFEDKFIYGECKRMTSEAPVPVFNIIDQTINKGGAGNVYENCINISPDSNIRLFAQKTSILKNRIIDKKSNHMFIRIDDEPVIDKFILNDTILKFIQDADIVIVSDYDKGYLSDEDLYNIGINSKLSIIDSKRRLSKKIIDSFSYVKLNEDESKQNIYCDNIIVTMGGKGCIYKGIEYPVTSQQTIDVSGAGDTFTASFIIKYNESKDIAISLQYANYCAGLVVSKKGVATPF